VTAPRPSIAAIVELLGLEPLPVEGGLFVQTWRSTTGGDPEGDVIGTATLAALTDDPDSFSAFHRLPVDEVWHFYLGDAVDLVLLHPDGGVSTPRLGHDIVAGERLQLVVPAGTWMGGALAPGGEWAVFGNTMAPGFRSEMYEGGVASVLIEQWPAAAGHIRRFIRPGHPTSMPPGL
jgi:predicted cupin superfamily sugar epimerase